MAPKKPSASSSTAPKRTSSRQAASAKDKAVMNTSAKREAQNRVTKTKKKATTTKAAQKKTAPAKQASSKTAPKKASATMNTSKKRKAEDDAPEVKPTKKASTSTRKVLVSMKGKAEDQPADAKPAKEATTTKKAAPVSRKPKAAAEIPRPQKGPVINQPPTQRLNVYVFGEGTAGELGLGTLKTATDVKRPRLNPNLPANEVGVVQIAAGGMHVLALTADNRILSWGVNDSGALGRDTDWDGGLRDVDAAEDDSDSDDDDSGMNPKETIPTEIDLSNANLPDGVRWVGVAAGDSCSFALTDDGKVYGWGTFRSNEGPFGFSPTTGTAKRPILIPALKNITSVKCGANHALALDSKGSVFAWGSGQQNQLGRRVIERNKLGGLNPHEVVMPKGAKKTIATIESGAYHSFAVSKKGDVYSWGLNNYGETGIMDTAGKDEAIVAIPQLVKSLQGKNIVSISGGGHHSLAATAEGEALVWGRTDAGQTGIAPEELARLAENDIVLKNERGQLALLSEPTRIAAVQGEALVVAAGHEHSLIVTKEGKAWGCGFSANYQTGLGTEDDVNVATMIDNTAVREQTLNGVATGGQFSILTSLAKA